MISGSIIHTNLHKPNNKLVSAWLHHFWCMDEPWAYTRFTTTQTILQIRIPMILEAHNFLCRPSIEMKSKQSCSPCWEIFNDMWHVI